MISNINTFEEGLYIDTLSREFIYLIFVQKGWGREMGKERGEGGRWERRGGEARGSCPIHWKEWIVCYVRIFSHWFRKACSITTKRIDCNLYLSIFKPLSIYLSIYPSEARISIGLDGLYIVRGGGCIHCYAIILNPDMFINLYTFQYYWGKDIFEVTLPIFI